jgi:hypothetical protein
LRDAPLLLAGAGLQVVGALAVGRASVDAPQQLGDRGGLDLGRRLGGRTHQRKVIASQQGRVYV